MAKVKRRTIKLDVPAGRRLVAEAAIEHYFGPEPDYHTCSFEARMRPIGDGSWVVEEQNDWGDDPAWGRWKAILQADRYGDDNEEVAKGFLSFMEALGHKVVPAEPCKPCSGTGKAIRRYPKRGLGRCRKCLGSGWASPGIGDEDSKVAGAREDLRTGASAGADVTSSAPTRRITQHELSTLRNEKAILASIMMARRLLAEAKTPEEAARCRAYIEGRERDLERERKLAGGEGG